MTALELLSIAAILAALGMGLSRKPKLQERPLPVPADRKNKK